MKRLLLLLALAFAYLVLAPIASHAQGCGPADEILKQLTGPKYSEVPAFIGTTKYHGRSTPVMGFFNYETGTFTVLIRPVPGVACIVIDGEDFEFSIEIPKPGRGT